MKVKFIIIFEIFFCVLFAECIEGIGEHTKKIERTMSVTSIQTKRDPNLLPINELPFLKKVIKLLKKICKLLLFYNFKLPTCLCRSVKVIMIMIIIIRINTTFNFSKWSIRPMIRVGCSSFFDILFLEGLQTLLFV